jgi:penicillin-binding protein 2
MHSDYSRTVDLAALHRRVVYLMIAILAIILLLFFRIWYLQVIRGRYYANLSENNRVRMVSLQPPRGMIYDRHGRLLANNVPSFNLYMMLEDVQNRDAVIEKITQYVQLSQEEIQRRLTSPRYSVPYLPVRLKEGLSMKEVALIEAHRLELPGVEIQTESQRNYPYGNLAAHLLGYVGEVSSSQIEERNNETLLPGSVVGQYGIERSYESFIRGTAGEKGIEVDAMGHEMKQLYVKNPVSGNDIFLTIDLDLQKVAEAALGEDKGAIVALDPNTGEILAMVSHPSFDANRLSRGISNAEWEALSNDAGHPLTNRAIQGQYPPGSVFKIVSAAAALETKEVTPSFTVFCRGGFPFGNRIYRDWKAGGHGWMDLHQALVQSCDVYFYEVGRRIGVDRLAEFSARFGLGDETGVELLSEKKGLIPSSAWKESFKGEPWFPGETLSVAIGQGYLTVTPLQLASLIGTVANGGMRYQPILIKGVRDRQSGRLFEFGPVKTGEVGVSRKTLTLIQEALHGVVTEPRGTGVAAKSRGIEIAGKTGTAQVIGMKLAGGDSGKLDKRFQDHAWFVSYAPVTDPRIAVAVIVENGGHGGSAAAPLARKVIEDYLHVVGPKTGREL